MSERFTLRWEQTLEDHVAAEARLARRRLWLRWPLQLLVVALGAGLLCLGTWVGLVVVLVALALAWWSVLRKSTWRRALAPLKESLPLGEVTWEAAAGGLTITMPGRRIRVGWHAVREVKDTREVLLLFVTRTRALFVPRRAVDEVPDFVAKLEQMRTAGASALPDIPAPEGAPWAWSWVPSLEDHLTYVHAVASGAGINRRAVALGLAVLAGGLADLVLGRELGVQLVGGLWSATGFAWLFVPLGLIITALALKPLHHRAVLRQRLRWWRWVDPDSFPLDELAMAVSPEGIWYRNPRGSGLVAWRTTTSVGDVGGCVNLMIGPLIGFSIPDRLFAGHDERRRFIDQVTDWSERATRRDPMELVGALAGSPPPDSDNPFAPPGT